MIKKSHIGNYLKLVMMAGLLFVCSCNDDNEIASSTDRVTTSDVVTFNIQTSNRWTPDVIGDGQDEAEAGSRTATRSRSVALPMVCVGGNAPATDIYMYMIEEDYLPEADTMTVASRSSETTRTPSSDSRGVGVIAYHTVGGKTSLFMDNINLTNYQEDKYWPGTGTLDFYAYYPHVQEGIQTDGLTLSNDNNTPVFTYEVPTDISKQRDLMDGLSMGVSGNLLSSVDMQLNHVMSQIQVSIPGNGIAEGEISSITFKNIYNKGTRIMGQTTDNDDLGWQLLPAGVGETPQTEDYELKSDFLQQMYLMPQQLSEDAEIVIEMLVESDNPTYKAEEEGSQEKRNNSYTLSVKLRDLVSVWEPNKKYTYVVSTPEEVKVEVTDEVERSSEGKPMKSNLSIKNIGLSDVYIRASIVGNWVLPNATETYADDIIVAAWKPEEEGDFVWGSHNKNAEPSESAVTGWRKHADGFYYHLNPVERSQETAKLFESYTLTAQAPMAGAVLDLTIIVQAVLKDDVTLVWPKEITSQFVSTAFAE